MRIPVRNSVDLHQCNIKNIGLYHGLYQLIVDVGMLNTMKSYFSWCLWALLALHLQLNIPVLWGFCSWDCTKSVWRYEIFHLCLGTLQVTYCSEGQPPWLLCRHLWYCHHSLNIRCPHKEPKRAGRQIRTQNLKKIGRERGREGGREGER